ncbi:AsnC family transcriptional regulator [Bacillus sp. FJAT-27225]|uniref:Lrp/AsnC family transcriptional regulator n=1 Tax=Bacillus sp. FJAT-27225 TaxID=1743144 RepID=UPI00080C28E8|nr:AsnC family transcriptional regulator [Bacillus sp. FJAT-27225]OCA87719.1 AsnC family transcriptional regulator [Bacillus sp. FJAT-27225]
MEYEIDELDKGIIKFLSHDGRMSFSEIAANLKVSEKTVRLRYKNLIDTGIMEVVGVVNPVAMGVKAGAIIQLKVQPQRVTEAIEELSKFKEIRYITLTSGPYSLLVQIAVATQEHITQTLLKLNELPSITEVNSIIQLEVYKNTFEYL